MREDTILTWRILVANCTHIYRWRSKCVFKKSVACSGNIQTILAVYKSWTRSVSRIRTTDQSKSNCRKSGMIFVFFSAAQNPYVLKVEYYVILKKCLPPRAWATVKWKIPSRKVKLDSNLGPWKFIN